MTIIVTCPLCDSWSERYLREPARGASYCTACWRLLSTHVCTHRLFEVAWSRQIRQWQWHPVWFGIGSASHACKDDGRASEWCRACDTLASVRWSKSRASLRLRPVAWHFKKDEISSSEFLKLSKTEQDPRRLSDVSLGSSAWDTPTGDTLWQHSVVFKIHWHWAPCLFLPPEHLELPACFSHQRSSLLLSWEVPSALPWKAPQLLSWEAPWVLPREAPDCMEAPWVLSWEALRVRLFLSHRRKSLFYRKRAWRFIAPRPHALRLVSKRQWSGTLRHAPANARTRHKSRQSLGDW